MKILATLLLSSFSLMALSQFQSSQVCKKCHPIIYKEHFASQHRKASIYDDAIHKAVWDKHPLKKKGVYKCAKCHTPNDQKLIEALKNNQHAMPTENKAQHEGVSCVSCHNIVNIERHSKSNTNITTRNKKLLFSARQSEKNISDKKYETKKSMFGFMTKQSGSPFHEINFTNELYYNGNVCMGCHSHKENAHGLKVCETTIAPDANSEKENCITCHMPKVEGSFSTMTESKTHRFHGFSGAIHKPKMLSKYIHLNFKQQEKGFAITIKNKASHPLMLHPLRVATLNVTLISNKQKIKLQPHTFVRVIGTKNKPSPPWTATQVLHNTQLKGKESRTIHYNTQLHTGDEIVVTFGYYIVNPKMAPKLKLEKYSDFVILKQERFYVK